MIDSNPCFFVSHFGLNNESTISLPNLDLISSNFGSSFFCFIGAGVGSTKFSLLFLSFASCSNANWSFFSNSLRDSWFIPKDFLFVSGFSSGVSWGGVFVICFSLGDSFGSSLLFDSEIFSWGFISSFGFVSWIVVFVSDSFGFVSCLISSILGSSFVISSFGFISCLISSFGFSWIISSFGLSLISSLGFSWGISSFLGSSFVISSFFSIFSSFFGVNSFSFCFISSFFSSFGFSLSVSLLICSTFSSLISSFGISSFFLFSSGFFSSVSFLISSFSFSSIFLSSISSFSLFISSFIFSFISSGRCSLSFFFSVTNSNSNPPSLFLFLPKFFLNLLILLFIPVFLLLINYFLFI